MADASFEFRINADPPQRLDKALSRDVPEDANLSRTRLAKLLEAGDISVNGTVASNAKAKLAEGDIVRVTVAAAEESHILPQDIALDIVYEDDALVVVNKPVGMVVHPAPGTPDGTLVNALMHHCGDSLSGVGGVARPGIVHRIDKDTSGLLVVAKTDEAHHGLAKQFEAHTVERHYRAVVYGVPDASDPRLRGVKGVNFEQGGVMKVSTQLARHKHDRQKQAVFFTGGRHAITRARVVRSFGVPECISLVDCWLETGRTHQIRVHMAHVGHGLVGDQTYGGRRKLSEKAFGTGAVAAVKAFERQALHAATLGFTHPVSGERLRFEATLPADLENMLAQLPATGD